MIKFYRACTNEFSQLFISRSWEQPEQCDMFRTYQATLTAWWWNNKEWKKILKYSAYFYWAWESHQYSHMNIHMSSSIFLCLKVRSKVEITFKSKKSAKFIENKNIIYFLKLFSCTMIRRKTKARLVSRDFIYNA